MRLNTWAGQVQYRPWDARNVLYIEDPFDATDNPGRSLARETVGFVADEFKDAVAAMKVLRTKEGKPLNFRHGAGLMFRCGKLKPRPSRFRRPLSEDLHSYRDHI